MQIFKGLFDTDMTKVISVGNFLLCVGISLILGLLIAVSYMYRNRYTKSFVATLAFLPSVVCVVIMMVNGNIGTGVAVAGAFGLVRFRSVPGNAGEICALFLAMGAGLIAGTGYLAYAVLFTVIVCLLQMLFARLNFGGGRQTDLYKTMRITIPEDLNYGTVFDDIFTAYTDACEITAVNTTNMGSLFRLTYDIKMKKAGTEKAMIDELRTRNGNLEITISRRETGHTEL